MASKYLILLRHGKSDWNRADWQTDFDRPINTRGQRESEQIGKWLRQLQIKVDVILCSSALRTQQTMLHMLKYANLSEPEIDLRDHLYHAPTGEMLDQAQQALRQYDNVLMIGHNPGIEGLLSFLLPQAPHTSDGKIMTTATCAVIEFEANDDIFQSGQLVHFTRGKQIDL